MCVRVCVRVCVHACGRVSAHVHACVRVHACYVSLVVYIVVNWNTLYGLGRCWVESTDCHISMLLSRMHSGVLAEPTVLFCFPVLNFDSWLAAHREEVSEQHCIYVAEQHCRR